MSGKEFFTGRYRELGWHFREVTPKQAIRINTINTKGVNIVDRLEGLGVKLEKIPFLENGYWVAEAEFSIGATFEYLLGYYSIQEAAAQIPATLFTELKNSMVLDACAAPGGKTIQLADLMDNTGVIVALDVKRRRLNALANQLERCRVKNTLVYHLDATQASKLGLKFDRILLDVPCSGNFATDKQWFERRTITDVERNVRLQREILAEAAKILKDDGEIVYATCSLEPEENEFNINWALENLKLETVPINCYGEESPTKIFDKKLDSLINNCRRIWPSEGTQGFFVCKLKKRG
ncbi:MAG: RsmB/NOP family class I SAM-dependent RNA methyltransferase [Candidatus Freyarchaeota archaeon]|nr:RsmB/NOP family class I SAM-dependent RNA methyltransferase [Candidatus Jordarchaeia archaeon]MBS7267638.1 RsmB/NOP family class I SAM-dependent RNA methyltransferase [Candidatus Jordarchaeia archaeon]MBS7278964.1 RsmB/NOP family class I SAM-dependent RNA methyltransferase [Candidatus Jordarchaeia archaeon]